MTTERAALTDSREVQRFKDANVASPEFQEMMKLTAEMMGLNAGRLPAVADVKFAMLHTALNLTDDNVVEAAKLIGIAPSTAYTWIKKDEKP